MFSSDLIINCTKAQLCNKSAAIERQSQLREGLGRLKQLQARIQAEADLRETLEEVTTEHAKQLQLLASDPEHQRQIKLRVKHWLRRGKEPREDQQVNEWGSKLEQKLKTLPSTMSTVLLPVSSLDLVGNLKSLSDWSNASGTGNKSTMEHQTEYQMFGRTNGIVQVPI